MTTKQAYRESFYVSDFSDKELNSLVDFIKDNKIKKFELIVRNNTSKREQRYIHQLWVKSLFSIFYKNIYFHELEIIDNQYVVKFDLEWISDMEMLEVEMWLKELTENVDNEMLELFDDIENESFNEILESTYTQED